MQVTTKRNVGDTVWTVSENKAKMFAIGTVNIAIKENSVSEMYYEVGQYTRYDSERCFDTKEELIEYIFNEA